MAAVELKDITLRQKKMIFFFGIMFFGKCTQLLHSAVEIILSLIQEEKKAIKKILERVSIHTNGLTLLVIVAAITMTLFATPTDATRQTCPQNVEVPSITEVNLPIFLFLFLFLFGWPEGVTPRQRQKSQFERPPV